MEVVAIPFSGLPCELETFTINGKDAYIYDFGEGDSHGDCFECECCHRFITNKVPMENILEKYQITNDEYNEICSLLEDKLYVLGCGLCS